MDSLFDSSNDDETDITSGADTDSPSEIDDDSDDDTSLFDGEVLYPYEYDLAKEVSLDVQLLWLERYASKT